MTHRESNQQPAGDGGPIVLRPHRTERLAIAAVAFAVLAVAIASLALIGQYHANHGKKQAQKGASAAVQALGTANSSLTRNGLSPVPTPTAASTVVITQSGRPGPAGPGPSVAQIQDAVDFYCATTTCGSGPTAAQVATAVATYCNSRGQCRGRPGASVTGSPGPQGASGAPGQNATADQVAAAVATWCSAHSNCQGPAGPSGVAGSPGASGSAGSDGQPPVSWTYTDVLGIEHTCRRTEDFNPGAPTYTCN